MTRNAIIFIINVFNLIYCLTKKNGLFSHFLKKIFNHVALICTRKEYVNYVEIFILIFLRWDWNGFHEIYQAHQDPSIDPIIKYPSIYHYNTFSFAFFRQFYFTSHRPLIRTTVCWEIRFLFRIFFEFVHKWTIPPSIGCFC